MLPPRRYKTFLNDKDGMSARDYLLLLSTSIFFLFVAVGLVIILFQQKVDKMYLSLLDMVSPVVMMIVGSVFGIQAVEVVSNKVKFNKQGRPIKQNESEELPNENIDEETIQS